MSTEINTTLYDDEVVAEIASLYMNLNVASAATYSLSTISLADIVKLKDAGLSQGPMLFSSLNNASSVEACQDVKSTADDIKEFVESLDDKMARYCRMYLSPQFVAEFDKVMRAKNSCFTAASISDTGVVLDLLHNEGAKASLTLNYSGKEIDQKKIKAISKELKSIGINLKIESDVDRVTTDRNIVERKHASMGQDLPKRNKTIAAYCSTKDAALLTGEYTNWHGDYINCGDKWSPVGRMMATMILGFHVSEITISGHTAAVVRAVNNPCYSRIFRTAMDIFSSITIYTNGNAVANGELDSSAEVRDAFFIKRWLVTTQSEPTLDLGFVPESQMVKDMVSAYSVVHVNKVSGRLAYSMPESEFTDRYSGLREEVFQSKLQAVMLELVGPKIEWYSWIQANSAARGNGILDKIAAEFCKE